MRILVPKTGTWKRRETLNSATDSISPLVLYCTDWKSVTDRYTDRQTEVFIELLPQQKIIWQMFRFCIFLQPTEYKGSMYSYIQPYFRWIQVRINQNHIINQIYAGTGALAQGLFLLNGLICYYSSLCK